MKMNLENATQLINKHGVLLVYPVNNKREPLSLWHGFFPRSEMRWEWDTGGDNRVANLWYLREELSRSGDVVYAKWYRGRATFFSREIFTAMMSIIGTPKIDHSTLGREARNVLDVLEIDSPLSTKELKKAVDLQGRHFEGAYTRALKELWSALLIVGFGEVDEGAFPSLAVGATKNLFEDLYKKSAKLNVKRAKALIHHKLPEGSRFMKFLEEVCEDRSNKSHEKDNADSAAVSDTDSDSDTREQLSRLGRKDF
jgi:hypothetical protein